MLLHDVDSAYLHLEVSGEGVITASGYFRWPAEVEIVNPELYLFTVDDPKAHIEFDMTVERGRGLFARQ